MRAVERRQEGVHKTTHEVYRFFFVVFFLILYLGIMYHSMDTKLKKQKKIRKISKKNENETETKDTVVIVVVNSEFNH